MKEEKKMIKIVNNDGTSMEVELITYLISEDNMKSYLVYSKGEKVGTEAEQDEIVYVCRINNDGNTLKLSVIDDEAEWQDVQQLLKKVANV